MSSPFEQDQSTIDPPPDLYRYEVAARGVDKLEDLEERHIQFFHEQGYLVVQQAFEPAVIKAANQAITYLIDNRWENTEGLVQFEGSADEVQNLTPRKRRLAVRKLMSFGIWDDRLKTTTEHPGIVAALRRLLGEAPVLFQEMALLKPPHIGREKPWHQDCAYFDLPLETPVVAIWIALEEATPQNGCLHLIPGSHRSGPMPHFKRRDWQICDADVAVDRGVMVPLKPGGCLFWHGLLHHGSPPNHSSLSRRALQYHYKPASAGEISREERLQLFGGEVAGGQC